VNFLVSYLFQQNKPDKPERPSKPDRPKIPFWEFIIFGLMIISGSALLLLFEKFPYERKELK